VWARVAFAVRCAQRVRPLFTLAWPDAPAEHVEALDRAIALAQASAASPASASVSAAASAAYNASDASGDALSAYIASDASDASDAPSAASAAASAAYAASAADAADAADAAASAAAYAYAASASADAYAYAIHQDFELLRSLAKEQGWTDDTAVGTALLGPLWPDGKPEGWPDEPKPERPEHLKIELVTPAGLTGAESDDLNRRVAAFFAELSALHVAMGGTGLRLVEHNSQETVPEEDRLPVGSDASPAGVCR
jgi:hypothetical protein